MPYILILVILHQKSIEKKNIKLISYPNIRIFIEGTKGWERGINVLECKNSQEFTDKVWNNPRTVEFRENLINSVCNGCRSCPIYDI